MRKIAVLSSFMEEHHIAKIRETAAACGFAVDFYADDKMPKENAADYEVLYGLVGPGFLKYMTNLKWFCTPSAGVEPYTPDEVYPNPDVLLTNSAGAYGITISEHMICVLLMMMRRMPEYQALIADRGWAIIGDIRSIYDSTVTIVGMGDIGSNFGRRLKAMGATVRGVRRTMQDKPDWCDEAYTIDQLTEAVKGADVVAFCLPGTQNTQNILNKEILDAMEQDAYVINVGRGTAIDQQALYDALKAGKLAGAALDVSVPEPLPQDHFLWDAPNLLLTPHVSGNMSLAKTCELVIDIFLRNLAHWKKGEALEHLVDIQQGY